MKKAETINERLVIIIQALGENPNSFSVKIGYGAPTTQKILKNKNKPGSDYICAVLKTFPQLNARWWLLGEGQMIEVKK